MNQNNGISTESSQNKLNSFTIKMLKECRSSKKQELEDKIVYNDIVVNEVFKLYINKIDSAWRVFHRL